MANENLIQTKEIIPSEQYPFAKESRDGKPGPGSMLNEELTLKIRKLYLDGYDYVEIHRELGINTNTWDYWVWKDYQGFRVFLQNLKGEYLVREAEKLSKKILKLQAVDDEGKVASDVLRVQQKEMEFVRETLGKAEYSKRSELTGKDGDTVNLGVVMLPPRNTTVEEIEEDDTNA